MQAIAVRFEDRASLPAEADCRCIGVGRNGGHAGRVPVRRGDDVRPPQDQAPAAVIRERVRPRIQAPNQVVDRRGRSRPVDDALVADQTWCVSGRGVVLGASSRTAPPASASTTETSRAAPSPARPRSTSSLVSLGPMDRSAEAIIGPASSAFTDAHDGHAMHRRRR